MTFIKTEGIFGGMSWIKGGIHLEFMVISRKFGVNILHWVIPLPLFTKVTSGGNIRILGEA